MSEEINTIQIEKEKIQIERLKVYCKVATVLITVALGTIGVAMINDAFQRRQLDQQQLVNNAQLQLYREKAAADRRQAEMEYLGKYLSTALQDDVSIRLRFAEYFAMLTISPDLQQRWKVYHANMTAAVAEEEKLKTELAKAQEAGDNKAQQELEIRLSILNKKLAQLKSGDETSVLGFTALKTRLANDLDTDNLKEREKTKMPFKMEFLNKLPSQLKSDLSESERKTVNEQIMSIKLLLIQKIWDASWGNFDDFKIWVESGAIDPIPEKFINPADYYRFGMEGAK